MRMLSAFLFCLFTILSCGDRSSPNNPANEVPKPLQDNTSGYGSFSKRGYDEDLVNALYDERLKADAALKELEEQITSLRESKADSLAAFNRFDNKSKRYYESANNYAGFIKDSLLRQRVMAAIGNSLSAYDKRIAAHTTLLRSIASGDTALTDLHLALKVVQTIPQIEQYQNAALPSSGSLSGFASRLAKTIAAADTLVKK